MSTASQQFVAKAWNFAHVLRDEGLSYLAYTEQITFLLFLKMAHEQTRPPHSRKPLERIRVAAALRPGSRSLTAHRAGSSQPTLFDEG